MEYVDNKNVDNFRKKKKNGRIDPEYSGKKDVVEDLVKVFAKTKLPL